MKIQSINAQEKSESLSKIAIYLEGVKAGKGNLLPLGINDLEVLWEAVKHFNQIEREERKTQSEPLTLSSIRARKENRPKGKITFVKHPEDIEKYNRAEKLFDETCKENMLSWNQESFKQDYAILYFSIIESIIKAKRESDEGKCPTNNDPSNNYGPEKNQSR